MRLIAIAVPTGQTQAVQEVFKTYTQADIRIDEMLDDSVLVEALVQNRRVERFFDELQIRFADVQEYRAFAVQVEAAIPRPDPVRRKFATDRRRERPLAEDYRTASS